MHDCIVIGAGIIGSTITRALRRNGMEVLLLDNNSPLSGTRPSGGHLKPSWFSGMKKTEYEPAMELLAKCWDLKEEQFVVHPTRLKTTVYRVDTDVVVNSLDKTFGEVSQFQHLDNFPVVVYKGKGQTEYVEERCRLLIVATGVWAGELIQGIDIQAKQGISFRIPGQLKEPFIEPWAPYKQIVAHQQKVNEIWVGDGTAILQQNWNSDRTAKCLARCRKALGIQVNANINSGTSGLRAYCEHPKHEPCLFKKLGPRAYVVTGAGKSGTIAAGWAASKLIQITS